MGERRERTAARTWAVAGLTLLLAAHRARAVTAPAESTPAAARTLASALGELLRADAERVGAELDAVPTDELDPKDAEWRSCVRARLAGQHVAAPRSARGTRNPHGFAARALTLYRDYWRVSATDPARRETAEHSLLEGLAALLGRPSPMSWDDIEPLLAARLERDGLHSLQGQTGRLRELMIWAKVDDRTVAVELPEQTVSTRVFYLNDFVSLGWGAYLTCDRAVTGGWTKPDALYAVTPGYASVEGENFRVSFLAHESQHFADLRRFPGLASWELEFRAKLVELALAVDTKDRILASFASNQSTDSSEPHSFANARVLAALRARLEVVSDAELAQVEVERFHRAALEELRADTARRTTASDTHQRPALAFAGRQVSPGGSASKSVGMTRDAAVLGNTADGSWTTLQQR